MIIETRGEFLARIGERIGDSDEDIAFLEDITDTYDSLASGADHEEVERLTAENAELRRKYKERFFKPAADSEDREDPEDPEEPEVKTTFEELFKEEK